MKFDWEMDDFTRQLFQYAEKMLKNSKMHEDTTITPENIYQVAHKKNRDLLLKVALKAHNPGSTILGTRSIIKLYDLANKGKSCIILSEHLSNFDVPSMFARYYQYPNEKLKEIFEKFIFIAGVKLNETPLVKLFTEMFSRVVIFPIRSLDKMKGNKEYEDKVNLARKINIKSTRKIKELRNKGHIFVMFPAGTRYRPWKPETKRGIKETTSYLRSFDYFCCSSINGNLMPPMEHEDMTKEPFRKDIIVFNYGEVKETKKYIEKICTSQHFDLIKDKENIKQYVVDTIMNEIEILHEKSDIYIKKLNKNKY